LVKVFVFSGFNTEYENIPIIIGIASWYNAVLVILRHEGSLDLKPDSVLTDPSCLRMTKGSEVDQWPIPIRNRNQKYTTNVREQKGEGIIVKFFRYCQKNEGENRVSTRLPGKDLTGS